MLCLIPSPSRPEPLPHSGQMYDFLSLARGKPSRFAIFDSDTELTRSKMFKAIPPFSFFEVISYRRPRSWRASDFFLDPFGVFGVSQKNAKKVTIFTIYTGFLGTLEKARCGAGFRALFEGASVA